MTEEDARLTQGLASLGITSSNTILSQYKTYFALLSQWNAIYNLTAIRDPRKWVVNHLLDSLSVARFVHGNSLVDVGSGAGLPGLPLAILDRSRQVTLVESNTKKAAFLNHAVAKLELAHVRVETGRVEHLRPHVGFDTVISRAFSSIAEFIRTSGHLLCDHGRLLAMKGRYPTDELALLPDTFECVGVEPLYVPDLNAQRHLVILRRKP